MPEMPRFERRRGTCLTGRNWPRRRLVADEKMSLRVNLTFLEVSYLLI